MHLVLREIAVFVVSGVLLFGAVATGLVVGGVAFAALELAHTYGPGLARLVGLTAGVAGFLAGVAGRDHAAARLRAFLDPGPEDGGAE